MRSLFKMATIKSSIFLLLGAIVVPSNVIAQDNSLIVDPDGKVGIGTDAPTHTTHIRADDAFLRVQNTNTTPGSRDILRLENDGSVNFKLRDTSATGFAEGEWTFRTGNSGSEFVIGKSTSGVVELRVLGGGNAVLAGNLSEGSSRAAKEDIVPVDAEKILDHVVSLPISEWSYKHDWGMVRHIGPMAEDFHQVFEVGNGPTTISSIDTGGVALAAIKGLNDRLQEKDLKMQQLETELNELRQLVTAMEKTDK